ncbi:helix-turn-helix domain-containing protein [Burkholderia sp. BCC1977]|uniref:helix-turn-helix domain-containing protein n=1 Tax=Burkholderia sp. BCC1977 TaxID=2817440 RepID=UPI002ABE8A73|nr:helix-turn-helix domain-containing protein [Burkholderia sp. BCC1977]
MTSPGMDDGTSHYRVPALARGLAILEAVASGQAPSTAAELATRLGVPRNSIARLLRTLVRQQFLSVDPLGRYWPGVATARVAAAYLGARPEVAHARPVLLALCARSGLAAQLLGRDRAEVVVLAQAAPDGAACVLTRVGARFVGRVEDATDSADAADAVARDGRRFGRHGDARGAPGIVAMPVDAHGALAIGVALDAPDDARRRHVSAMLGDAARRLSDVLADTVDRR